MKRFVFSSATLLLFAGLVVVWVNAQEPNSPPTTVPAAGIGAAAAPAGKGDVRFAQHLSEAGRSVAAEYGGVVQVSMPASSRIDAADSTSASGDTPPGLHSVLKRPGPAPAPASLPAAAPAAAPALSVEPTDGAASPGASALLLDTNVRTTSRSADPDEPAPITHASPAPPSAAPATAAGSDANTAAAPPDRPASSRRTYRSSAPAPEAPGALPAETTQEPLLLTPPTAGASAMPELPAPPPAAAAPPASRPASEESVTSSTGALLRVDTSGPAAITLGEEATFLVRVANLGGTDATGVVVRVNVPEQVQLAGVDASAGVAQADAIAASRVAWTVDRLPVGSRQQLAVRVVPQSHEAFEVAVDWSMQSPVSTARVEVQQPLLEIALDGPAELEYGQTQPYTIVVSNPGTGAARGVAVDVRLGDDAANTLNVGEIPPGGQKSFEMEVTARQPGNLQLAAAAAGSGSLQAAAEKSILVKRAALTVEAVGPQLQYSGTVGSYRVRLSNPGNSTARSVQAAVRLPQGVKYLEGINGARQESGNLVWPVGPLAPGAERVFDLACELAGDGSIVFQFLGQAEGGLQATAEVTTRVDALADLKLTVNDPKGPIRVGHDVTYEIQIVNRGTKAATQVNVVAQFSEGIEPTAIEGLPGRIAPGQVIFEPIGRIEPNETLKLVVQARAEADGNHVFRAAVDCAEPETRLVAEDTTQFYGSTAPAAPAFAAPGTASPAAPQVGNSSIYAPPGR